MSEYAKKTCYDCGIRKPAPYMERVTESYESGRSNTTVTAGNLVFGALGDKRGQNAVGRAIKGNNRRSYTRNRTVWKCMDCSGTNDWHRNEVRKDIVNATKAIFKAKKGGIFSAPKNLPESVNEKLTALQELSGTTSSKTSQELLSGIKVLVKNAPDADPSKFDAAVAPMVAKVDATGDAVSENLDARIAQMEANNAERTARIEANKAKMQQTWAERRQLSPTEVKIINFVLTMFEWMLGWTLVGFGVIGGIAQSDIGTGLIVSGIGFGVAMLFRKFKQKSVQREG